MFGDADRGRVSFQWDREGACSHRGPKTEPSHAFTCAKTLRAKRVRSGVRCDWHNRRKFRDSNFRQYGQMKSRDGKSQRREEERESLRRKKIQVCEKVGKSRNTVFFQ